MSLRWDTFETDYNILSCDLSRHDEYMRRFRNESQTSQIWSSIRVTFTKTVLFRQWSTVLVRQNGLELLRSQWHGARVCTFSLLKHCSNAVQWKKSSLCLWNVHSVERRARVVENGRVFEELESVIVQFWTLHWKTDKSYNLLPKVSRCFRLMCENF